MWLPLCIGIGRWCMLHFYCSRRCMFFWYRNSYWNLLGILKCHPCQQEHPDYCPYSMQYRPEHSDPLECTNSSWKQNRLLRSIDCSRTRLPNLSVCKLRKSIGNYSHLFLGQEDRNSNFWSRNFHQCRWYLWSNWPVYMSRRNYRCCTDPLRLHPSHSQSLCHCRTQGTHSC